jgi:hypothetical protein
MQRTAFGQRSATTLAIQLPASAETSVISLARSSPSSKKKKRSRVFSSRPSSTQTRRPLSWSTATIRYLCPRWNDTSSIPIRRRAWSWSLPARRRRLTRATIQPTVGQETRISSETPLWVAMHGELGHLVIEAAGEASIVVGLRHGGHRHPVLRAAHSWCLGFDEGAGAAQVEGLASGADPRRRR